MNEPGASSGHSPSADAYQVVARRYRPRSFSELVGQSHVVQALINAIETDRVGHAYLFTGARGVGKTSTARIFAKALNAPDGPTPYPDNDHDICRRIDAGDDMDVLEIDGASNRGIDEIRQLRAGVNVRPSRARYKIYIIDEVHMLTPAAFNALLKTLEEPPGHVKFIFCTTDPDKIPITVLSRCQRFDFAPVEVALLVDRLEQILREEQREADPAAVQLIARHAGGSVRDSQSLLEQLLAFTPGRLTVEAVHAMLGTAPDTRLAALLQALSAHDAAASLAVLNEAVSEGIDPSQFSEQLMQCFRDAMLLACGGERRLLAYQGSEIEETLATLCSRFDLPALLAALQILDHTLTRIRHSTQARTLVEMALVRLCHLKYLTELPDLLSESEGESPVVARSVGAASVVQQQPSRATTATPSPVSAARAAEVKTPAPPAVSSGKVAEPPARSPTSTAVPVDLSHWQPEEIWKRALERVGDDIRPYTTFSRAIRWDGGHRLVVEFAREYTLHKERCERPATRSAIESALQDVAGSPVALDLVVAESGPQAEAPPPAASDYELRYQRERDPLVQEAVELFDAEVSRVDDPPKRR